jgi:hypothetical protein
VAGAVVRVQAVQSLPDGPINASTVALGLAQPKWTNDLPPNVARSVTADTAGRFELTGFGPDRLVKLQVRGAAIEYQTIIVVSRPGVDARWLAEATITWPTEDMRQGDVLDGFVHFTLLSLMSSSDGVARRLVPQLYSSDFTHVSRPTQPITGTVRERATGRPTAEVRVTGSSSGSWWDDDITATTDAEGRYRLVGLPKEAERRLWVDGSAGKWQFLPASKRVTDAAGLATLTVDFDLGTGVVVEGTLTDRATGRPVAGLVSYAPLKTNTAFLRDDPRWPWHKNDIGDTQAGPDGRFRLLVWPGPGALLVKIEPREGGPNYAPPTLSPAERAVVSRMPPNEGEPPRDYLRAADDILHPLEFGCAGFRLIDPAAGATPLTIDFALVPAVPKDPVP